MSLVHKNAATLLLWSSAVVALAMMDQGERDRLQRQSRRRERVPTTVDVAQNTKNAMARVEHNNAVEAKKAAKRALKAQRRMQELVR